MENLTVKIILNVLGIVTFFWVRFANRTDKAKEPTLGFWWENNYEPLIGIALLDIAMVMGIFIGGFKFSFEKIATLPDWIQVSGDGMAFYAVGVVFAWLGYEAVKKIILEKK